MRLSTDKISHLSHLIKDRLVSKDFIEVKDSSAFLRKTKELLLEYCQLDEVVDEAVRKKISSYSRNIMEGSREWDVMYKKHFEEEMNKRW